VTRGAACFKDYRELAPCTRWFPVHAAVDERTFSFQERPSHDVLAPKASTTSGLDSRAS